MTTTALVHAFGRDLPVASPEDARACRKARSARYHRLILASDRFDVAEVNAILAGEAPFPEDLA
jgi:hypothetical protein